MLTLIWFVITPVLVLLGALALEHMQSALLDGPSASRWRPAPAPSTTSASS